MFEDPVVKKLQGNNLSANNYFHTDPCDDRWHMLFTDGTVRFLRVKSGELQQHKLHNLKRSLEPGSN